LSIWAIADLHLAVGNPSKDMSFFGSVWENYMEKIALHWRGVVSNQDLVLIAGDISWAMHLEKALVDLDWIEALPGTKVIIRGNHDYWWGSAKKMRESIPSSIHFLHNTAFHWNGIAIAGTRLWDSREYSFRNYINFKESLNDECPKEVTSDGEKIFQRELQRLTCSLQDMDASAQTKICMTHYPPIGATVATSVVSELLERFGVTVAVFGHLHNVKKNMPIFGKARGVRYCLTSCDYLDFHPLKIL
jgi:uncharacterized protein